MKTDRRSIGWNGLKRGHHARPAEWLAEKAIFLISLSAIIMVFLIFLFVAREALPVVLGKTDSSLNQRTISPDQLGQMSKVEIMEYLELKPKEFARLDQEALKELMQVKKEAAAEAPPDKDARLNTTTWRNMVKPHQWTGYDQPEYIWQPVSQIHKYNLVPLIIGSLKTTLIALLFSVPLALGAAIYVSQLANPKTKEWLKPAIEMLAGVPSVVLGFFALLVMATVLQNILGTASRLNAVVAGLALSLAVIPLVFSIAEDALTSVPRTYTQAALALGSSRWQAAWKIVLPAAIPGVFAAVVLGFGRAIGETMVVLLASGNASIVSWNLFDSTRTMTASIAAELAETVFGGTHYRILFLIGASLFLVTFLSNMVADVIIHRLKARLEGKA
ncbi:MAG TPA: phosphate ABC transporter permease subunit PstC [Verrucomicrobiae bacterium]|nr:phosphate ABC transporter permease subunit PstC [Verrucomicrobiae bacterium]